MPSKIINIELIQKRARGLGISFYTLMKRHVNYRRAKGRDCMSCEFRRNNEMTENGVKGIRIQCEIIGKSREKQADVGNGRVCDYYKFIDMNVGKE